MKPAIRLIAIALAAGAAATAFAQTSSKPANPTARGNDIFYYAPLQAGPRSLDNPLSSTGIGRAAPRSHSQVTPVPEPSQWAMMLAGLALVGFIVRRSSKRS
jgi:hypothetical protein